MKGLKKIALASAIAAVSAGAQAELKALDDSAMGELTGQAGLTIDIETKWSIAEFMYKDAGSLLITGIEMGGDATGVNALQDASGNNIGTGSYLDNIRMTIDIAGAGAVDKTFEIGNSGVTNASFDNTFDYGFSKISSLAAWHVLAKGNADPLLGAAAASGFDAGTGLFGDRKASYGDGDLVIHWSFKDVHAAGGGYEAYNNGTGWTAAGTNDGTFANIDYATARAVATRAVDYNFKIDAIGLASSSYVEGTNVAYDAAGDLVEWESTAFTTGLDTAPNDTILISQIDIKGYLGPMDLHIENNGNGFNDAVLGAGRGKADSEISWDSYFRIEDLDLYIDIAGVLLEDITINNDRGDLSGLNQIVLLDGTGTPVIDASGNPVLVNSSSFGFAHSKRTIYAVKDAVVQLNAQAEAGSGNVDDYVDGLALNTEFKGDISIQALSFGDTGDSIGEIHLTDVYSDTRWTISAH